MAEKPAVSVVAVAGRRRATLELAQRIEREGFTGIYCPSPGDGLGLCHPVAQRLDSWCGLGIRNYPELDRRPRI